MVGGARRGGAALDASVKLKRGKYRFNFYAVHCSVAGLREGTQNESLLAVVDEAGDFASQVPAMDNHFDEAVFEHELGGLKPLL